MHVCAVAAAEDLERARVAEKEAASKAATDAAESCAVCGQNFGADQEKDDLWIACDVCNKWFHGSCADVTTEMLDIAEDEDFWECQQCWLDRYIIYCF